MPNPIDDLKTALSKRRVLVVAGTGVSRPASGSALATWGDIGVTYHRMAWASEGEARAQYAALAREAWHDLPNMWQHLPEA